jgi:hypothetical protein
MSGRCPQGCGFDSNQDIVLSCIHVIPQEDTREINLSRPPEVAPVPNTAKGNRHVCGLKTSRKNNKRELKMKAEFTAIIERAPEGGFWAIYT